MQSLLSSMVAFALASCSSLPARSDGAAPSVQDDATHPFGVHDMLAMERVSDAQVSPDGGLVLFNLRTTDLEADRGRTDVWVVGVDGTNARRLTTHPGSDFNARWAPDGRTVYFLSTRSGSSQVWQLPLDGGEAHQVTDFPVDVGTLHVFPDGERFALSMAVHPDAESLQASADRDAAAPADGAVVYDELLFRHWDHWEDGKRNHVFVWSPGGGEPVDLMRGLDADCPTDPFGGPEEIAIAPDGIEVALVFTAEGRARAWTTNMDVWTVPADGSAAPRNVTAANRAFDSLPSYSPDGATLAYVAMARPGYEADRQRIVLMERATGAPRVLTEAWDRSAGGVTWSADGATIYTTTPDLGRRAVFAVDVATGAAARLTHEGHDDGVAVAGERLLFARDSLRSPVELHTMNPDGSDVRPITFVNARRMADVRLGEYEQFSFEGAHGDTVHGYVMKPADYEEGARYPVAFLIHGGPQGSFGDHFHYRWNPQAYAGAGYAAVFIDFHGSTGYGQAFTDAIRQDWGGAPYEDLMTGLDAALERYAFLDGERVAALGASYGGYMINWIAGHSERFRCFVNHDGVFDTRAMYYETEELWFVEWENEGTPWEVPENYERWNPVNFVGAWKTPMLVVQGGLDFRVPESQAMGAFTALQRRGVPSRFLYFPEENHWVLKPKNSVRWHAEVLDWLAAWTK